MCLNAIKQAHIKKIYYAAKREKNVSRETSYYFQKEYQQQSSELLKKFFETKRK